MNSIRNSRLSRWPLVPGIAMLLLLLLGMQSYAYADDAAAAAAPPDGPEEPAADVTDNSEADADAANKEKENSQEAVEALADDSKSGYSKTVNAAGGGGKSVSAELVDGDRIHDSIFGGALFTDFSESYYRFKKAFNKRTGIAYNVDYSVLASGASYTFDGDDDAASSVFRIYGAWNVFKDSPNVNTSLIFKYEHRGAIDGPIAPRDLGFNTESALSTANYKQNGWGWTDLYVKTILYDGRVGILFGHMDPGDWADQHVLLNAWTNLLNDSFYNNPAEAIPHRTFSLVTKVAIGDNWYVGAGVHDANGKDNHIDFKQVWDTPELFTWAEFGFKRPGGAFGESTHIHVWHTDQRVAAGVEESWGVAFSSSYVTHNDIKGMIRLGYSEGDGAQMRRFVGAAISMPARGSDRFQFGVGWGSPPDSSLRDQTTLELLYRVQFTQHIVLSPDLQVTFNPSFTEAVDKVYMWGLRFRLTF